MKGSAITGPVGKEAAELWPVGSLPLLAILYTTRIPANHEYLKRIASNSGVVM
jgi:hypothetical protein